MKQHGQSAMQANQTTNASGSMPKISNKWYVLIILMITYMVNYLDRTIVYLLQEPIKNEFALADWQIGMLGGAAFGIFYSILGVPIARIAERMNRTAIISISIALWSAMTALCGFANSYVQLLLMRIGVAVGEAGASPPSHSIVTDYFPPERRGSALSIYVMGVPIGQLLGAVLGGALADTVGWRWAFIVVGAPGVLLAILVWLTVKEPPRGYSDIAAGRQPSFAKDPPPLRAVLRHAKTQTAFIHALIGSTVAGFAGYGITAFTAAYFLRSYDLTISSVGLIVGGLYGLSAGAGILFGGFATDLFSHKSRSVYGWLPAICLAFSCPLLVWGFSHDKWLVAMAFLIPPMILKNAHIGPTYSIMHNSFEPRMRATVTSLLFLAHSLIGLSFGPMLLGFLSDLYAASHFSLGDFNALCHSQAPASDSTLAAACRSASAVGVRNAIMTVSVFYVWGAAHYLLAARALAKAPLPYAGAAH